jgi:hypothetical protein
MYRRSSSVGVVMGIVPTALGNNRGIDMSGRRPLIKGYFAVLRLIADAVMSSGYLMRVMTPVGPDVVR